MSKKNVIPCTEVKSKIRETFKDGKKIYLEEKFVLTRKIKRQRAKETLKAMDVKHPCRREYDKFSHEYLPSSLATHWREYGSQI